MDARRDGRGLEPSQANNFAVNDFFRGGEQPPHGPRRPRRARPRERRGDGEGALAARRDRGVAERPFHRIAQRPERQHQPWPVAAVAQRAGGGGRSELLVAGARAGRRRGGGRGGNPRQLRRRAAAAASRPALEGLERRRRRGRLEGARAVGAARELRRRDRVDGARNHRAREGVPDLARRLAGLTFRRRRRRRRRRR